MSKGLYGDFAPQQNILAGMESIGDFQQLNFLVVEDEDMEFTLFQHALKKSWKNTYSLIRVRSLAEALDYLGKMKIHVVFLDLNIDDSKGLSTVRKFAASNRNGAVVIVTTSMSDKKMAVESLRLGAQDYLIKGEYSPEDLARALLHSLARAEKSPLGAAQEILDLGSLKVDLLRHKLIVYDKTSQKEIDLTSSEIKLLAFFVKNHDSEVSREAIAEHVLGGDVHVSDRTVDNQVSRLRSKLSETGFEIQSIRGVGYAFKAIS